MAVSIPTTPQAEMTIRISDMSIINDIRRLLSHVNGIEAIKVKRTKSEVELSLEEAHAGKVTQWNSVDDYFKTLLAK